MQRVFAVATAALALAGCAYNAPVAVSPNLNVYTSYGDKLPGNYLLYVESERFKAEVKPTGLNCGFHKYPLDITQTFRESVIRTIQQLVDDVQIVDSPVPARDLVATGKRGMIIVRAEDMTARIQMVEGFWTASATANVELSASTSVDLQGGRALGTTASGSGNSDSDAGAFCAGGANALGVATEKAVKQLLGQIGERISNSPRLREPPKG